METYVAGYIKDSVLHLEDDIGKYEGAKIRVAIIKDTEEAERRRKIENRIKYMESMEEKPYCSEETAANIDKYIEGMREDRTFAWV